MVKRYYMKATAGSLRDQIFNYRPSHAKTLYERGDAVFVDAEGVTQPPPPELGIEHEEPEPQVTPKPEDRPKWKTKRRKTGSSPESEPEPKAGAEPTTEKE